MNSIGLCKAVSKINADYVYTISQNLTRLPRKDTLLHYFIGSSIKEADGLKRP